MIHTSQKNMTNETSTSIRKNEIHIPVMEKEVIQILQPTFSKVFADFTFGFGGHTKSLLSYGSKVIGIDRDYHAYKYGKNLESHNNNFKFIYSKFSNVYDSLPKLDGILMDIGVSSAQLDYANRGFSFMKEGPLTMQMGLNSISAHDIINTWSEKDIADVLYLYADERKSRSIAKKIVEFRKIKKISTTTELANIIANNKHTSKNTSKNTLSKSKFINKIHPATKTFQAIRIATNSELHELCDGLQIASEKLKIGGKLAVISFHSIEDRIIKQFFKKSNFLLKKPQPIMTSNSEIKENIRSRSAKLRWGIKL